jgi:hypothetical protein
MYTVIDSARSNKDPLRANGIKFAMLPFLLERSPTEQDVRLKEEFISDRSDLLEQKLKRIEIVLSICSLIVLALAIAEVKKLSMFKFLV